MGQNKMFFHELVKGNYGRKIAYADVEEVNEKNILDIVGDTLTSNVPVCRTSHW